MQLQIYKLTQLCFSSRLPYLLFLKLYRANCKVAENRPENQKLAFSSLKDIAYLQDQDLLLTGITNNTHGKGLEQDYQRSSLNATTDFAVTVMLRQNPKGGTWVLKSLHPQMQFIRPLINSEAREV